MFDLHLHSTFSDGSDKVEILIDKIKDAGVHYFSVTDHDTALSARTILSSEELKEKIRKNNLTYVTGVEWSCRYNGYSMHILAYDFDPFMPEIFEFEKEIKEILKEQTEQRLIKIQEQGYIFSKKSIEFLNSVTNVKKPHLANCLVRDGYFETIQDAMNNCLSKIRLPKKFSLDAEKVIRTLSKLGAKMVWAHSIHGLGKKPITFEEIEDLCIQMKEFGLSGLECYYSLYTKEEIDKLIEIANKLDLFITVGSDYHGENKVVKIAEVSSDGSKVNEKNIKVKDIFKNIIQ